jgi:hypothetical protein
VVPVQMIPSNVQPQSGAIPNKFDHLNDNLDILGGDTGEHHNSTSSVGHLRDSWQ